LDEFPAGYSLTGLLSSMRVSASPAGVEDASRLAQLRGSLRTKEARREDETNKTGSESTLAGWIFCPTNGVHLRVPTATFRMSAIFPTPKIVLIALVQATADFFLTNLFTPSDCSL
jgi:hypothetical protein